MPPIVFRRSRARWPMRWPDANTTDRPIRDRLASISVLARDARARGWARGSSRAAWENPGWRRSCGKPCRRSSARALCRWEARNVLEKRHSSIPGTECCLLEKYRVSGRREVSLSLTCEVYKQAVESLLNFKAYQLNSSSISYFIKIKANQGFVQIFKNDKFDDCIGKLFVLRDLYYCFIYVLIFSFRRINHTW